MNTTAIPHIARRGLIARLAIQCDCPDTGETGSFLFSGESHRNKHSRVTPVYADLCDLFQAIQPDWEQIRDGSLLLSFVKR